MVAIPLLVFSGPPLLHATGMQLQRSFAGVPLVIESPGHFDDRQFVERSIPSATARATMAALDVLTTTLDASLQMIDDIGLTTGAPAFADFPYWRSLAPAERNAPCVCRSGRKTKQCHHAWSDPAPVIPETFGSCTGYRSCHTDARPNSRSSSSTWGWTSASCA